MEGRRSDSSIRGRVARYRNQRPFGIVHPGTLEEKLVSDAGGGHTHRRRALPATMPQYMDDPVAGFGDDAESCVIRTEPFQLSSIWTNLLICAGHASSMVGSSATTSTGRGGDGIMPAALPPRTVGILATGPESRHTRPAYGARSAAWSLGDWANGGECSLIGLAERRIERIHGALEDPRHLPHGARTF